jgi:preprotein translocase subunit SecF
MSALTNQFGPVELQSSDFVAPSSSASLVYSTIFIVFIAFVLIMGYIWFRFKTLDYSVSALLSTLHDVLVVVGFIGAMRFEVNTVTIAAVLTIIGYSLNDTVVIFDRIRECFHTVKEQSYSGIIDMALTQTLNRTVITSLTTIVAILPLMILAMGSVQLFAIEMFVGVLVGTYSSLFVGSVSLNAMHEGRVKKLAKIKK